MMDWRNRRGGSGGDGYWSTDVVYCVVYWVSSFDWGGDGEFYGVCVSREGGIRAEGTNWYPWSISQSRSTIRASQHAISLEESKHVHSFQRTSKRYSTCEPVIRLNSAFEIETAEKIETDLVSLEMEFV